MIDKYIHHLISFGLNSLEEQVKIKNYYNYFTNKQFSSEESVYKLCLSYYIRDFLLKEHNWIDKLSIRIANSFSALIKEEKCNHMIELIDNINNKHNKSRLQHAFKLLKLKKRKKPSGIRNKSNTNKLLIENKSYIDVLPKNIKLNVIKPKEKIKPKELSISPSIRLIITEENQIEYNKNKKSNLNNTLPNMLNSSFEKFEERQNSFHKAKITKLIKLKSKEERKFSKEYTFKPVVNSITNTQTPLLSRNSNEDIFKSLHEDNNINKINRLISFTNANNDYLSTLKNNYSIKYK